VQSLYVAFAQFRILQCFTSIVLLRMPRGTDVGGNSGPLHKAARNFVVTCVITTLLLLYNYNSVALVRNRTIPTERPQAIAEVSANF
jgi:hypothetical protein